MKLTFLCQKRPTFKFHVVHPNIRQYLLNFLFFFPFFKKRIFELQYCVNFRCRLKWFGLCACVWCVCVCVRVSLSGFPGGTVVNNVVKGKKKSACQLRRHRRHKFDHWVRKTPWRRKWQPAPVFLPEESHGQRSLAGYKGSNTESNTAEWAHTHSPFTHTISFRHSWLL